MLTPKQHKLLLHIQEQTAQNGYAPSYDEMRDAMGLRSKSGIHRLVCALEHADISAACQTKHGQ